MRFADDISRQKDFLLLGALRDFLTRYHAFGRRISGAELKVRVREKRLMEYM
jgi:hypothetical protein